MTGNVFTETSDHVIGTKGSAELMKHTVSAGGKVWEYPNADKDPDMYDQEHVEFYQGIRGGNPINNGVEGRTAR